MADWNAATAADLKPSTVRQRKREIDNDLLLTLKSCQIGSITHLEPTALLKGVEIRAPEVARNLRNHLWGGFEYAIDSGLIANNPVPDSPQPWAWTVAPSHAASVASRLPARDTYNHRYSRGANSIRSLLNSMEDGILEPAVGQSWSGVRKSLPRQLNGLQTVSTALDSD